MNTSSLPVSMSGAAYLPLADNKSVSGHIIGTVTYYDENNTLIRTDHVDRNGQGLIGSLEIVHGLSGRAMNSFDFDGKRQHLIAYVGSYSDSSEVYGFRKYTTDQVTLLPRNLTVGDTWSPAPAPIQCQVTLKDRLNQFTTKNGTSYSDVLKIEMSYLDSSYVTGFYSATMKMYKGSGTFYFSRGIGLVEADIENYEHLAYRDNGGTLFGYVHEVGSGTVSRN